MYIHMCENVTSPPMKMKTKDTTSSASDEGKAPCPHPHPPPIVRVFPRLPRPAVVALLFMEVLCLHMYHFVVFLFLLFFCGLFAALFRIAYEEVLSTMVGALGDQPQDVLRGAADEVLAWLKVGERAGESQPQGCMSRQQLFFYHGEFHLLHTYNMEYVTCWIRVVDLVGLRQPKLLTAHSSCWPKWTFSSQFLKGIYQLTAMFLCHQYFSATSVSLPPVLVISSIAVH